MHPERLSNNKQHQLIVTFATLAVVVLVVVGARAFVKSQDHQVPVAHTSNNTGATASNASTNSSNSANNTNAAASNTNSSSTNQNSSNYKDGTYSATGMYDTPDGAQAIDVKLTVKSGVVTDSQAVPEATSGDSVEYQDRFVSGYKTLVVGKSLDNIHLSRVSGSSLTSGGFNSALEQIKSQAKT